MCNTGPLYRNLSLCLECPPHVGLNVLQVGADIVKRALSYPLKLIAKNAGVNGSVVIEKVPTSY